MSTSLASLRSVESEGLRPTRQGRIGLRTVVCFEAAASALRFGAAAETKGK